jgi:hypothetical protein
MRKQGAGRAWRGGNFALFIQPGRARPADKRAQVCQGGLRVTDKDCGTMKGTCHCGAAGWEFQGTPKDGLVCNCSFCRRTGSIWAYGHEGAEITLTHPPGGLVPYVQGDRTLANLRCPHCGILVAWRGLEPGADGQRRVAVNLRLADPAQVRTLPLRRFDGADTWESQPDDGRCIADLWL